MDLVFLSRMSRKLHDGEEDKEVADIFGISSALVSIDRQLPPQSPEIEAQPRKRLFISTSRNFYHLPFKML
jgi:hypothetical protein